LKDVVEPDTAVYCDAEFAKKGVVKEEVVFEANLDIAFYEVEYDDVNKNIIDEVDDDKDVVAADIVPAMITNVIMI
jgi:hypothetical protein